MSKERATDLHPPAQPNERNGSVDLLVITDQKDSSRNVTQDFPDLAKRHFREFVSLLKNHRPGRKGAFVVKNIGDSLMIRLRCLTPKTQLPNLLWDILQAQNALRPTRDEKGVSLRVIVMALKEFIDGEHIPFTRPTGVPSKAIPPKRWRPHWLAGDVFGPNVALAFRAAQIPTDPILVVQDEVAALLSKQQRLNPFSLQVDSSRKLYFSEALAFSPFKGLEELYPFAQRDTPDKVQNPWWPGHLFLRVVRSSREEDNPLLLEQQKVRAFTKLVWGTQPDNQEIAEWVKKLSKIEGSAGYIRSIGRVRTEISFPKSADAGTKVGLMVVFAGPMESTYGVVRRGIESERPSGQHFPYPVSTFVYSTPENRETTSEFWPRRKPPAWYVLVFAKWNEPYRRNPPATFQSIISAQAGEFEVKRCGELMGGEWDIYCFLFPKTGNTCTDAQFDAFASAIWRALARGNVERAMFYLCKERRMPQTFHKQQ